MGITLRLDPDIERVILAVLADYDMTWEELIIPGKARGPGEARLLIVWLCRQLDLGVTESEVAWSLKREHSMLRNGVVRLERDMARQPSLQRRAAALLQALAPKAVSNG